MEGQHAARDIQQEGNQQCRCRAKQKACGCGTVCKGFDEAFAVKEAACVNHADDTADNQHDNGQNQVDNLTIAHYLGFCLCTCKGSCICGIEIIVQLCISFMLQHRAEVCIGDSQCQHCYNTQQCIEVIGNGSDEQIQAVHALNYAGYCRSPGGNGSNDTDRSRCCIDDIRKLRSGNLMRIRNGTHNRAYGQAVEIVIHEYQNTQQEGGQQCTLSCFDCLNCPTAIRRRAACLIHQRNHDTQNNKENQNPHIVAVGKLCQHTAVCDISENRQIGQLGAEVRIEQTADHDTDEQRGINLLCNQCQNDCNQRRHQRPCGCIHFTCVLCRFCIARKNGYGHGCRYQNNHKERSQPCFFDVAFCFHNPSPFRKS